MSVERQSTAFPMQCESLLQVRSACAVCECVSMQASGLVLVVGWERVIWDCGCIISLPTPQVIYVVRGFAVE